MALILSVFPMAGLSTCSPQEGQPGAVTFVQRFGGALNLHPHFHSLVPDGLFVPGPDDRLQFRPLPPPTPEEISSLTHRIGERVTRLVTKMAEAEALDGGWLEETAVAMREAWARSLRAPAPADQLSWEQDHESDSRPTLRCKVAGFSLHAGRWAPAADREALERLCRYGLRAPFSQERLSRREDGQVVYELRRPWPNASGVRILVLEPAEFLRRLAALIPAPGLPLTRYHGAFANRSKLRSRLPAPPPRPQPEDPAGPGAGAKGAAEAESRGSSDGAGGEPVRSGRTRVPWAQLLYRILFVDALLCPRCGGRMKVLAFLSDLAVARRILESLGLETTAPPLWPARSSEGTGGGRDGEEDRQEDPYESPWMEESVEGRAPP